MWPKERQIDRTECRGGEGRRRSLSKASMGVGGGWSHRGWRVCVGGGGEVTCRCEIHEVFRNGLGFLLRRRSVRELAERATL